MKPLLLMAGTILISAAIGQAGETRTWTDRQGQTIKAEFVRIYDGKVVLKAGVKTTLVPLSQLSPQDQQYLEEQLNRKAKQAGDEGAPLRTWTDTRGNQVLASFVRIDDNQVWLMERGLQRAFAYMLLSEADRTHIKDLLRRQNQAELVAALEKQEEEAAKAAEAARQAAVSAAAQSSPASSPFPGGASMPRSPASEAASAMAEQMRQQAEARRQENQRRWEEQQQQAQQRRQEMDQRMADIQRESQERMERSRQASQQLHEQLSGRTASMGSTMVTEYRCSNCNKVVPESVGPGSNCPHCGVYFEYTQSPTGERQYASNSESGGSSRFRLSGRAIKGIVFLIITVCGGVAGLWRKFGG